MLIGTHRLRVAPVDTRMSLQDPLAHQAIFQIEEFRADVIGREFRIIAGRELRERGRLDLADLRVTLLLLGDRVGGGQILFRNGTYRRFQLRVAFRLDPVPLRLAGFGNELVDGLDGDLHLIVSEDHRAQHHFLVQALGLGLDHENAFGRARDHEIELRLGELRRRRIQQVLAVAISDARRADRAQERHAGNRERRGRTDQRGDVRIHFRIDGEHRGDDLHVVGEALRKQWANRAVDQTGGERLFLGGTAFALEEAAGDAACGVGLFLIIDREREEVPARRGFLQTHRGHEHHRFAHRHEHRAVGLSRELPGLDRYGVLTILKTLLGMAHVGPFYRM